MIESGEYLIDCGEICDRLSLPLLNFIWNHREDFDADKLVSLYNRLHRWDMKTLHLNMTPEDYDSPAMLFELSFRSNSLVMAKLVYRPDLQQGEFSHYWGDSTPDDAVLGMRMNWLNTLVRLTGCLELMIHKKVEW